MVHQLIDGHQHDGLRFPAHIPRVAAQPLGQVIARVAARSGHVHQMAFEPDLQTRFLKNLDQCRGLHGLAIQRALGKGGLVARKLVGGGHQPDAPIRLPHHGTGRSSVQPGGHNKGRLFNPVPFGQRFPFLRCGGCRMPALERHTMELFGHGAVGHHAGHGDGVLPGWQWRGLAG